jgi:hypothetical protein
VIEVAMKNKKLKRVWEVWAERSGRRWSEINRGDLRDAAHGKGAGQAQVLIAVQSFQ